MIRSVVDFHRGMLALPVRVRVWVAALATVNLMVPLAFVELHEAQVVLFTFFASMALMMGITAWRGFTRLLGLGHILWIPLLIYLWPQLVANPVNSAVGMWLRALFVLNTISLVIDIVDVGRYLAGDRDVLVELPDV